MLKTLSAYPGVVYGAFFWDNWIVGAERWAQHVEAVARGFAFRAKLAEHVVRAAYGRFDQSAVAARGDCVFRSKWIAHFGGSGSLIPVEVDH